MKSRPASTGVVVVAVMVLPIPLRPLMWQIRSNTPRADRGRLKPFMPPRTSVIHPESSCNDRRPPTSPAMTVVTRFAPSPTGFLHIGGARTALFNWLYARGRGGKMLLRIEDTDRERSTAAAIEAILDGLSWLGLEWDGDTVYQFSRADRHREVAHMLLASGRAYRCYASAD